MAYSPLLESERAIINAPIYATNNTIEAISNGTAHLVNKEFPKSANTGLFESVALEALCHMATPNMTANVKDVIAASGHCLLSEIRGYSEFLVSTLCGSFNRRLSVEI